MLIIVSSILLFSFAFLGIGLLFVKAEIDQPISFDVAFRRFWLGLAITIAFLQIWHLFFPVNLVCQMIVVFVGVLGFVRSFSGVKKTIQSVTWLKAMASIGIGLVVAFVIGSFSIDGNLHYDHGLYHNQTVKWLETYAIIPGLGNVHHRLAFNSSSFLYTALLNQGIFHGFAFYTANSLLAWALGIRLIYSLSRMVTLRKKIAKHDLFYALTLPFLFWYLPSFYFSGYSNDLFVSVLQVFLAGEFFALLEIEGQSQKFKRQATLIIVSSVLMVCLKLSGLVYAAAFFIATLIVIFIRYKNNKDFLPYLFSQVAIVFAFGLVWLIRSVILSGYLLYPSALISFNVPWKMPSNIVDAISKVIYNWSRYGKNISPDTPFSEWLKMWLWTVPRGLTEGWILGSVLGLFTLILAALKKTSFKRFAGEFQVVLFSLLHILYWFLIAPEIRFIGMTYWIAFVSLLLILLEWFSRTKPNVSKPALVLCVVILNLVWLNTSIPKGFGVLSMLVKPPNESKIAAQFVNHDNLETRATKSGLTVHLPNGAIDQACWDLPLPCVPKADFHPRLRLINPNNIQEGFMIAEKDEE